MNLVVVSIGCASWVPRIVAMVGCVSCVSSRGGLPWMTSDRESIRLTRLVAQRVVTGRTVPRAGQWAIMDDVNEKGEELDVHLGPASSRGGRRAALSPEDMLVFAAIAR